MRTIQRKSIKVSKSRAKEELKMNYGGVSYKPDEDVIKLRELKLKNKQKEVVYISRIGEIKYASYNEDDVFRVDAKYQQKEMETHIDKTFQQYILKQEMKERTEEERNIAREISKNSTSIEEEINKLKEANIPLSPQYIYSYFTDNPIYKFTPDMFEFREKETNRLLKYKNK